MKTLLELSPVRARWSQFSAVAVIAVAVPAALPSSGAVARSSMFVPRGPASEGAEYIAVCVPAFAPDTVNRDPG